MKYSLAILSLLFAAAGLSAISAKVVDTDGPATAQIKSGKTEAVSIGRTYNTGDSIRTGKDGLVELDQAGLIIRVGSSTVFTLMEKELGGKPKGVLAVTLGTVRIKYAKLTGSEPLVQSVGCLAGVRGTELTVWAGTDGASQLIVDSGMVEVEAFGKTVALGPDEAVLVINGRQPGEKFAVPRERPDHRTWDADRIAAMIANPLETIDGMRERLAYFGSSAREYSDLLSSYTLLFKDESARVATIKSEQGDEAARRFVAEVVDPIRVQTGNLFLNFRYYVLAGISLRRFIGSRVYLMVKVNYLEHPDDPAFVLFNEQYREFLAQYEATIVPLASEVDF